MSSKIRWSFMLTAGLIAASFLLQERAEAGSQPSVKASSVLENKKRYAAENVLDGDPATAWAEGVDGSGIGQSLTFIFPTAQQVSFIGIIPGYSKYNDTVGEVWFQNNRVKKATLEFDDGSKQAITLSDYRLMQYFPVNRKVKTIKLIVDAVYRGTKWDDTCISEVAFIEQSRPDLGITGGPEFKTWPSGREKMSFAVKVLAPFITPAKRKPVQVAMVIDVSGSMMGEPLRYARESAKLVISALLDDDQVALVTFSTTARVIIPITPLSNKTRLDLLTKIDSLASEDTTNLSDGFIKGVEELQKIRSLDNAGRYVLFFTDGAANVGIQEPEGIATLARDLAQKSGARFSTFGLSKEFHEDLLRIIASESQGNYYFVKNPAEMLSYFGAEIGRISNATVRNVSLELVPPSGSKIENVRGGFFYGNIIKIGDLRAGESRLVLFDLNGRPAQKQEIVLKAHFQDPSSLVAQSREATYALVPSTGQAIPNNDAASDVAVYRAQSSLAESAGDINVDRPAFMKRIQDRITELTQENKVLKSSFIEQEIKYLNELQKDLSSSTVDGEIFIKGVKYKIQMIERTE